MGALCGLLALAACEGGQEVNTSEEFTGPWKSALNNVDIIRTMAENKIGGCDDKQYRILGGAEVEEMYRDLHAGTYLVACSDGVRVKLYEVETRPSGDEGSVKGPASKWPKDLERPPMFQALADH